MWIVVLIILTLALLIIFLIREQRKKKLYHIIDGEDDIESAKKFINVTKVSPNIFLTNRDHLDLASVYDFIFKDTKAATPHYIMALVATDDFFIIDKVRDRININNTLPQDEVRLNDEETTQIQQALMSSLRKPSLEEVWKEDNQNVHDSLIDSATKEQFQKIKHRVRIPLVPFENIKDDIKNFQMLVDVEKDNPGSALTTLEEIEKRNPKLYSLGLQEKEFIQYIYTDMNTSERKHLLLENLINNLKDCRKNNSYVCINGRLTRVLSSYAMLDDEGVGEMKSHQVLRNEIISKVPQVRDKIIDEAGVRAEYESGKDMPDITKKIVDEIYKTYECDLKKDEKFATTLMQEISAAL